MSDFWRIMNSEETFQIIKDLAEQYGNVSLVKVLLGINGLGKSHLPARHKVGNM